jgi:SAM-dependent methyltransferase
MENEPVFEYKGQLYPEYIKYGNACYFCLPFAQHFCKGEGLDVGGWTEKGWVYPGARVVNIDLDDEYHAHNLPTGTYDYIFSSHTLEHLDDYISALEHWRTRLRPGGALFLYLPHPDMEYWRPENNRKHRHLFYPHDVAKTLRGLGYEQVLASERDLYWAFSVVAFAPKS